MERFEKVLSILRFRVASQGARRKIPSTRMRSLQDWLKFRATFPWTNEQIAEVHERDAAALEQAGSSFMAYRHLAMAHSCRKGRVSKAALFYALGSLIKTCSVCGKKALYRRGQKGFCSQHRTANPPSFAREVAFKAKNQGQKEMKRSLTKGIELKERERQRRA